MRGGGVLCVRASSLPRPQAESLLTGQLSWLLMWPVTAAWAAARRGRWALAGALVGAVMSIKLFLLVIPLYLLITRRTRAALVATVIAGGCVISGLILVGSGAYRQWIASLAHASWAFLPMNASALGFLTRALSTGARPFFEPVSDQSLLVKPLWVVVATGVSIAGLGTASRYAIRRPWFRSAAGDGIARLAVRLDLLRVGGGWSAGCCGDVATGPVLGDSAHVHGRACRAVRADPRARMDAATSLGHDHHRVALFLGRCSASGSPSWRSGRADAKLRRGRFRSCRRYKPHDREAGVPIGDLVPLLVIGVAAGAMTWWTWGTWPDAIVDFGRELYVPWQLTLGKVLAETSSPSTGRSSRT